MTSTDEARRLSGGDGVAHVLSTGFARVQPGLMPEASVPAADAALRAAGLDFDEVDAVSTHSPFGVNDLHFELRTGFPLRSMNRYGCSLVYGHPRPPTGLRGITELIAELKLRGVAWACSPAVPLATALQL